MVVIYSGGLNATRTPRTWTLTQSLLAAIGGRCWSWSIQRSLWVATATTALSGPATSAVKRGPHSTSGRRGARRMSFTIRR